MRFNIFFSARNLSPTRKISARPDPTRKGFWPARPDPTRTFLSPTRPDPTRKKASPRHHYQILYRGFWLQHCCQLALISSIITFKISTHLFLNFYFCQKFQGPKQSAATAILYISCRNNAFEDINQFCKSNQHKRGGGIIRMCIAANVRNTTNVAPPGGENQVRIQLTLI